MIGGDDPPRPATTLPPPGGATALAPPEHGATATAAPGGATAIAPPEHEATPTAPPAPGGVSARCLLEIWLEQSPDPLWLLTRCAEEPGEIVHIPFGRSAGYLLANPRHVADVLVSHADAFSRDRVFVERFAPLLGNGLITAGPAAWHTQRRAVHGALQRARPRLAATSVALTTAMIDGYATGEVRDLARDVADLHWRILAETVLGRSPGPAPRDDADWHALKARLPAGVVDDGGATDGGDVATLLAATAPEQLRDDLTTLLFAGRDTSTSAIAWTLAALAQHPDAQDRLRAELRDVLADAPPDPAAIRAMPYLARVIKESLRLYPPTVFFTRDADVDVPLGGYTIPAGGTVILSPWITHRDARVFSAPLAFRPDRWEDVDGLPRAAYFPFGAGPRMCVGRSAALLEIALVVATMLQRLRLTAAPGSSPTPRLRTTLCPAPGVHVRVEERPA